MISEELARNLALAMLCVFLVTLFVLSNFSASFMVVICVLLSLVRIYGGGWKNNELLNELSEFVSALHRVGFSSFIFFQFTLQFFLQVDITGFMAFWGLTIDTVTTIILVIAIGLTVDYSAHIAHAFMVAKEGDKNGRCLNYLVTFWYFELLEILEA